MGAMPTFFVGTGARQRPAYDFRCIAALPAAMIGSPAILHTPSADRQAVGSIIIAIPYIPDSQLVYDEKETRQILESDLNRENAG